MTPDSPKLKVDSALAMLSPDGPLASGLKGFEARKEQKEMMRNVLDAFNGGHVVLIEAGTGTGKSLAYLIPAMLWAAKSGERTVISTNTITLQEQLVNKDVPLISKALGLDLKAVLVKGMHNYLCLRKLTDAMQEQQLFTQQENEELNKIDAWKEKAHDGSRSLLPFSPSASVWEKVSAENDTCNRNACPYFSQCHFFKARRQANEAQILISNHHLLFADLALRKENDNFKDPAILPNYTRIVLDEAHNIEDIATDFFASRVSQLDIMRLTARLASERREQTSGKLPLLKDKIASHYRKNNIPNDVSSILKRLNDDIPGLRRDLIELSKMTFTAFLEFAQSLQAMSSDEQVQGEGKLRILPYHYTHPVWKEKLIPSAKEFCSSILRYTQALNALINDVKQLKNETLEEQTKPLCFEIGALGVRLEGAAAAIERFATAVVPLEKVRWIELQQYKTMVNVALVDADLDISKILAEQLFSKFPSVILCSATLTTNKQFRFIRDRLGLTLELLPGRTINEHRYDSPFDFQKQAMMAIPVDIPPPSDPTFTKEAAEKIWQALQSSRGNAFVLFTSYTMLKACFEALQSRLKEHRFHALKQGDDERQVLLNKFKSTEHSVLFGTDSFWEGVDVAGEALRCVIIVKLPFKVPTEPLIQARSEAIAAKGGDPFMEYSLPQAIVKFKQGFGRLIRNGKDRGCFICLDTRLIHKRYGSLFLNSLPDCQRAFAPDRELQTQIREFYRKTHFMTKS